MKENDYSVYHFSKKELVINILIIIGALLVIGLTFYDNPLVGLFFTPVIFPVLEKRRSILCEKRKKELQKEFREALLSVSAGLNAGYSVENAFMGAYRDIVLLFGKNADMAIELSLIMKKLRNNQPIEQILSNLGERSKTADIMDFAMIFQIAKRSGGDLCGAIESTAQIIREKGEVEGEIEVMLAGKNMEKNIMLLIPFFMIGYLSLTSKGYFTPMYHNLKGIIISSICLVLYVVSAYMMQRVTKIEV